MQHALLLGMISQLSGLYWSLGFVTHTRGWRSGFGGRGDRASQLPIADPIRALKNRSVYG